MLRLGLTPQRWKVLKRLKIILTKMTPQRMPHVTNDAIGRNYQVQQDTGALCINESAQNKSSHGIYSHTSVSQTVPLVLYELLLLLLDPIVAYNFHDFREGNAT